MQMVAATKMRKAQTQAVSARPYISTLSFALSKVAQKVDPKINPLLSPNEAEKVAFLVFSSDKGFCGSLNSNLFREIMTNPVIAGEKNAVFYTMGKKARDFIVRSGRNLEADFENFDSVSFSQAVQFRKFLMEAFLKGELKEAYLLYPDFISTLRQEPKLVKILPIDAAALVNEETSNDVTSNEFVFEPDPMAVLDYALVHLVDTEIYQGLLETKASEFSARMMAMQNATNNAKDLVDDLTLTYNQARQDAITRELLEIASAGAALEAA